jgi:ATP-dependent Clp protease ATP-binding subunit ClpB
MSHRYISDRHLPDKAIDLVDEAAARVRIENDSLPSELDELRRRILQLEIEREALKKEKDNESRRRLDSLVKTLAELSEQNKALTATWENERQQLDEIKQAKQTLADKEAELDEATRRGDLELAARIRYGELGELHEVIRSGEEKLAKLHGDGGGLLREEVTTEEIANVVAKWTGIPVARLLEGEKEKLLKMEERLAQRVVGQREAVKAVANAVRRNRAGLGDPNRPIGSFLFLGPTGVGKTELCKALASLLFNDEAAFIRLDMGEFMEAHSVARMIGAPPGYIGYEQGGRLTEAVRRKPYSVILLDELEKAHSDVTNVLLQVLDDGRLTDGQGRTVDFKNSIIVMTSNLAGELIQQLIGRGGDDVATDIEIEMQVRDVLKTRFRPEFLNRIDETIVFHPLSREHLAAIAKIQVDRLQERLAEQGIRVALTDAALQKLAADGYDPAYGARPLKRLVQQELENPIAERILDGRLREGSTVTVDAEGEAFCFAESKHEPAEAA